MFSSRDAERRFDAKLDGDLRDAYVELLSAQCAVDRMKTRYTAEEVASKGSQFMVSRSIAAANAICEYFSSLEKLLFPKDKPHKKASGEKQN
jgi:hypothetical protein